MDCNKCLLCRCGKFEAHGMSCIIEQKHIGEVENCPLDRLAAYEDAEEKGLLVRLPCKVGTPCYKIWQFGDETAIVSWEYSCDDIQDFGHSVFLTREDAEAALKEG